MYQSSINTPYFNYLNSNINNPSNNPDDITSNLDGLIYMIKKESYYSKIMNAVELAGKYKQENKRYYFNFHNLENNSNYKLDANDIILAKKQINDWDKYKNNVKYKLYNDGYNNRIKICNSVCYNEKYNNQDRIVNLGYNSVSDKDLNNFLNKNSKSTEVNRCNTCIINNKFDKIYLNENDINQKSSVYQQFYKEYREACFYVSYIRSKINHIKNTSLTGKTSNIYIKLNNVLFPNLPTNEKNKIYTSQNIMIIYNSVVQFIKKI